MAKKIIGMLTGGGTLPASCARAALDAGDEIFAITFKGQPQPENLPKEVKMFTQSLGAIGQAIKTLKKQDATHILMAGNLTKSSLFTLRPDVRGVKFLAGHVLHHDDALLSSLVTLFHHEGFEPLSVKDIAPSLLAPKGVLTTQKPTSNQLKDIEIGQKALIHMSPLDIGQSLIVKNGVVLGVEAIEGTNNLIARCANLRGDRQKGGILVKMAKVNQSEKADLPTIGAETIAQLQKYGYDGLAIQAGKTILLDQDSIQKQADKAGLFITSI